MAEQITTPKDTTPLYVEGVHILDGLAIEEVDSFLEDHRKELSHDEHSTLVGLLIEYQDVFLWSYNDMKGLGP